MSVTKLSLSDGAKSNVNVNDQLNMSAPQAVHVTNGDVYLDWTIKASEDEAKITSFKINHTYVGTINEDKQDHHGLCSCLFGHQELDSNHHLQRDATISHCFWHRYRLHQSCDLHGKQQHGKQHLHRDRASR